jgi:hypothetical protein
MEIQKQIDNDNIAFIALKGNVDINGKKSTRSLAIYSSAVLLRKKSAFCAPTWGGQARCEADVENLRELIARWID